MSTSMIIGIISIIVVILVLALSLVTIGKGYTHEHKVDPLPGEKADSSNENNADM
jgi:hypothetical protein